jgi:shikimate kinase
VGFRDTDEDIARRAGKPIPEIFVDEGEAHFRDLEEQAVEAALRGHGGVLALGGGAVLSAATRRRLTDHRVVFLSVELADAARRVGLNRDRPLLLGNVRQQLRALLDARLPLYQEVATVVVATDGRSPQDVAGEVLAVLGPPAAPHPVP